jgi:putative phosphoribosyl transferase
MGAHKLFRDRVDAGRQLALRLAEFRKEAPVVLGLPRGGVPVAYEVARSLDAPLDVCVVRKIGAPGQPEFGVGAVAEDGVVYIQRETLRYLGIVESDLADDIAAQQAEVEQRTRRFRRGRAAVDVRDHTVIVVDDGVATGGTARAALQTLRSRGAARVILAVPVGASDTLDELATVADEVVCLRPREQFRAVSLWYEDFEPTTDEEVITLLARAERDHDRSKRPPRESERVLAASESATRIPVGDTFLEGNLTLVPDARALVVFVHGSGSSRHSPRNACVATVLNRAGISTLLFDLLTEDEEAVDARTGHLRFDIPLLASRLAIVTEWAKRNPKTKDLDIGYFGASTGAAAALVAAAKRPDLVHAIVSRGGRPDLAEAYLGDVQAPTLLLVGGLDGEVLTLNRETLYFLGCEKLLEVVPGATHLFEEPGTLEEVARSATRWFSDHLGRSVVASSTA